MDWTAWCLVIIGAVNWLLVGLFQFDLVAALFGGQAAPLTRLVYILVGLSGIYAIYSLTKVGAIQRRRAVP